MYTPINLIMEMLNWDFLVNLEIPSVFFVLASLVGIFGYGIFYFLTKTDYGKLPKKTTLDLKLEDSYDKIVGPLFFGLPLIAAAFLFGISFSVVIINIIASIMLLFSDIQILTVPISTFFYLGLILGFVINTFKIITQTRSNMCILHNAWILFVRAVELLFISYLFSIVLIFFAVFVKNLFTDPSFFLSLNFFYFIIFIAGVLYFLSMPIRWLKKTQFKKKDEPHGQFR